MIATGLAGGATGTRIIEQLTAEAILCDFVRIGEESRTSTAVIDPTSGVQTEVNEIGPAVTESEVSLFCDKLTYLAKGADICVFAGSLPRGVDDKVYAELITELKRLGVMTVIDAEGEPMEQALRSRPDLVSPNSGEAEQLVGHEFRDDAGPRLRALRAVRARARARRSSPTPRAATRSSGATTSARCTSCASTRSSRCRRSAPGTRSWPATSRLATPGGRTATRCGSPSPAGRSRRCTSAPACSTRARPSGSSTRSC